MGAFLIVHYTANTDGSLGYAEIIVYTSIACEKTKKLSTPLY